MNKELGMKLLQTMIMCRRFEEKLFELFSTRVMPGTMHQYNGQEAVASGVCAHLDKNDYVTSTHRGHGHCVAKGADMNAVMAEMFAKSTGCCKGMGGSMHIADFNVGMLGANGIVGGGIPIAVGAGLTCRYRNKGAKSKVSVAFFGDGATNEGSFHESVNLAAIWKLPVLFVVENNVYGFSTHYKRTMLIDDIADRAVGYGIPGKVVDGMDVKAVYETAGDLIGRARTGGGPAILECKTYRFRGHSRFEDPTYRTKVELAEWKKKDPIEMWTAKLREDFGVESREVDAIEEETARRLEEAVQFAENSPEPAPGDYKQYIFA